MRNPKSTDLQDAEAPEDVATILRNAVEKYREAPADLSAAWGDPKAGAIWDRVANSLDAEANKQERIARRGQ